MKNKNQKGISLIVLLITILVMAILLSTVVLSMKDQNLTDSAYEVRFKEKIESYKIDIEDYVGKKEIEEGVNYNKKLLNATVDNITYDSQVIEGNIFSILHSMSEEDSKIFMIKNGELIYYPYNIVDGQVVLNEESFSKEEFDIASLAGIISYHKTNLIGYYEAINNLGGAYSSDAIKWKDLSLKNNDGIVTKDTNECWTQGGFLTNGSNASVTFPVGTLSGSSYTIEVVYKDKDTNTKLLTLKDNEGKTINLNKVSGSNTEDKIYRVMYTYNASQNAIKTYNLSGGLENTQSNITLGNLKSIIIPADVIKEYYTIRVYDGLLSSLDSTENTSIDSLRFENIN